MSMILPIISGLVIGTILAWIDGLLDWFLPEKFKMGRYDWP